MEQNDPAAREWTTAAAAVLRKIGRITADDPDERVWDVLGSRTVEDLPHCAARHGRADCKAA